MTLGRVHWAAALVAIAALSASRGGAAQTLTLEDVEARAQRERPELVERRASIEKARAEVGGVQAKSRPTLAARGDVTLAPGGQLVTVYDTNDTEYFVQGSRALGQADALLPQPRFTAMLSGKLTILDFGRTSLGERAAESALRAEQQVLIQAKVELVRSARSAYLAWIEAHETWQLAQKDSEVTAARTSSVRELILEGARPATDATLSAYDEQLAKLRATRARRATRVAFEALSAAVADKLPEASVPDPSVIEPEPQRPAPPVEGVSPAAAAPALRALELQRDAALSAARAADRSHAPQLDALGEFGLSGQDAELFPVYRAALSLSVPIYDGGAQSALAEQHRAEARGLDAHRQKLELALQAQQSAAQSAIRATGEELALTLELLATAETLLSQAEEHYRSGSDTLERVLSAQRSLVQARREVLSAKLENARARLELAPVHIQE